MTSQDPAVEANFCIRAMTIDDMSEVFHIGAEVFIAKFSPTLYRTWDEYEITTLFNFDNELCLVAELEGEPDFYLVGHVDPAAAIYLGCAWLRQARGKRVYL
jgi:hypothetical protein